MKKGDIVLIDFPFTDLAGSKLRPGLVLAEKHSDIITAFITSNTDNIENDELVLKADRENRLKGDSKLRLFRLATLNKNKILGKIGSIKDNDLKQVDEKLKVILQLN